MTSYFVTFRSVTFAQRAESTLRSDGISCALQRTPRWMEAQGCGYYLRLNARDSQKAIALLRQKQIPFRKVYLEMEKGSVEEVEL